MWRSVGLTQYSQRTALWPFVHTDTINVLFIQVGMAPERPTVLLFAGVQGSSISQGNPGPPTWEAFPPAQGRERPRSLPLKCPAKPSRTRINLGEVFKNLLSPWLLDSPFFPHLGQFSIISLKGPKWEGITSWASEWLCPILPHSGPESWVIKRPSPF